MRFSQTLQRCAGRAGDASGEQRGPQTIRRANTLAEGNCGGFRLAWAVPEEFTAAVAASAERRRAGKKRKR
eukprot:3223111-Rhodomonas_salina.1